MLKIPPEYRKSLGIAVGLHIILLIILAIKLPSATVFRTNSPSDVKIVHAVAINSTAVQNEINKIKMQEQQKQQQEQQRKLHQLEQEKQEQQKQMAAQAHLQALQQQALALQKQREVEQIRVAQLQAEHLRLQKEAQQVAELKKQAEILAKQKTAQLKKEKFQQQQKLLTQQQQLQQQLLQNQMAQEQKQLTQVRVAQMQGILDQYKAQIIQAIQQQWLVPDNANKDLSCILLIRLAPSGVVLKVETARSSGDTILDQSARDAVFKASPLPVPQDPAVFESFRELRLTVRPLQVNSG